MKLWDAMQRIERCRYQAEVISARLRECPPEYREIMHAIERQWLELAAQTQALFDAIDARRVSPVPIRPPPASDWDHEPLEQRRYL